MPIHVLSPEVAAKIAAGEVVERPASVVKELVENGLDAGARTIHVETAEGGQRLIRVLDDGCGIPGGEVRLAFDRHSTSKLTTAEDLECICTLGFRGEALASIAAVSRMALITRSADDELGSLIYLEGGQITREEWQGHPQGTAVTVENLFYNLPARRKFLRAASTDRQHITTLVARYAMAYPAVRFTLIHDGRLAFQTTGRGDLREVCIQAFGLDVARDLVPLEGDDRAAVRADGLIGPPALHRASRDQLVFFVNCRWVQDRMLAFAVEEAYHSLLPSGRHPIAVVGVTVPPSQVDVNVHPAKSEVRFRDRNHVFRVVQRQVRAALMGQMAVPGMKLGAPPGLHRWEAMPDGEPLRAEQLRWSSVPPGERSMGRPKLPPLRVIGQLNQTYIIGEGPGGMYLLDQHAAHERVLYEQFRAQQGSPGVAQELLSPQAVDLTLGQKATLERHMAQLQALGFVMEPFGGQTVLIRALPVPFQASNPAHLLIGTLDDLAAESEALIGDMEARLLATVCKRAAIRAGQVLSLEEMRNLIRQLEETDTPVTCPHGRPTVIHLSQSQLDREFGR